MDNTEEKTVSKTLLSDTWGKISNLQRNHYGQSPAKRQHQRGTYCPPYTVRENRNFSTQPKA